MFTVLNIFIFSFINEFGFRSKLFHREFKFAEVNYFTIALNLSRPFSLCPPRPGRKVEVVRPTHLHIFARKSDDRETWRIKRLFKVVSFYEAI